MGASQFQYPHRYPDALGPLRLRMSAMPHLSVADGIWLPYGRDLVREGAHLVDAFPSRRGRIDRLAYAPGDWECATSEIFTRHGRVKVGSLPEARGRGVVLIRLHTFEVLRVRSAWPGAALAKMLELEFREQNDEDGSGPCGSVEGDWPR